MALISPIGLNHRRQLPEAKLTFL